MSSVRLAYLYIAPAALVMSAITFYPIVYMIWMSFTDFGLKHLRTLNPNFVGLSNFRDILTMAPYLDFNFFKVLAFNVVWTLANLVFHVGIGVALALALNTPNLAGRRVYRTLLILPWAVPAYVTSLVWRNMFDEQFGAINLLLKATHLGPGPAWLTEFPQAFAAVLLTNIWLGFPFMMMVASGALQSIPRDYYEAAEVDGASAWHQFRHITVPMLRPAMLPAIMLGGIWTFNNFNVIYFVTGGGPLGKSEILITQAYKLVNPMSLYGVASAFALIIFLILLSFTLLQLAVTKGLKEV